LGISDSGRVYILVTEVPVSTTGLKFKKQPLFKRWRVSQFKSRADLIATCLASVHIPFFMDGQIWKQWRGLRCIDGR
jgi:hypothetical protein